MLGLGTDGFSVQAAVGNRGSRRGSFSLLGWRGRMAGARFPPTGSAFNDGSDCVARIGFAARVTAAAAPNQGRSPGRDGIESAGGGSRSARFVFCGRCGFGVGARGGSAGGG